MKYVKLMMLFGVVLISAIPAQAQSVRNSGTKAGETKKQQTVDDMKKDGEKVARETTGAVRETGGKATTVKTGVGMSSEKSERAGRMKEVEEGDDLPGSHNVQSDDENRGMHGRMKNEKHIEKKQITSIILCKKAKV